MRGFSRSQGGRAGLFQEDRHLSDHACRRAARGDRREISLGRGQSLQGLRALESGGDEADGDPRIAPLAWYREAWEEQQEILGSDPWANGLTAQNATTIETLLRYSHEHGLTKRLLTLDDMFLDVSEGRKRGGFSI